MAVAGLTSVGSAQVRLGLEYGRVAFSGGSEPATAADTFYLTANGPDQWRGRVGYSLVAWEFSIAGTYSKAGLAVPADNDFRFVDGAGLKFLALEPGLARRLSGLGTSSSLWVEVGPSFTVWTMAGQDPRTKVGAWAAGLLRQKLAGAFDTNVRLFAARGPSFLEDSDNVPGIKVTPIWRYGVSIGLDFKF